jgi:hypothetical protein
MPKNMLVIIKADFLKKIYVVDSQQMLPDVKKIVYVLNMGFKNKLFIYLPKVRLVTTVSNRKVPGQRDRDPFFGSFWLL